MAEAANQTDLTALIEKKDANGRDGFLQKMQRNNSKEKIEIEIITTHHTSPIIKKESLAKIINFRLTQTSLAQDKDKQFGKIELFKGDYKHVYMQMANTQADFSPEAK